MSKELSKGQLRHIIAKNIAPLLEANSVVNLGMGIPQMVSNYVTDEQNITFHVENGLLGMAEHIDESDERYNENFVDSGGERIAYVKGASTMDSSMSFAIVRGGHLDATVLGTLQVDEVGNIANYAVPGKRVTGMGGAMDLCTGAKRVIVATTHTSKGQPKLVKACTFPLTAQHAVTTIVTEKAVINVDNGFEIVAYNPLFELDDIIAGIDPEAKVTVSDNLQEMNIDVVA